MIFKLPELDYSYGDLERFIDARTMEIHHQTHHRGYIDNLNKALSNFELGDISVIELVSSINKLPEKYHTAVANYAGGHANHSLFWQILSPKKQHCSDKLSSAMSRDIGGYHKFEQMFIESALDLFGSGWVWLTVNKSGCLGIEATSNQNSPLMQGRSPILALDIWEHAYYLRYQNRRTDYVEAFFQVINWIEVSRRYELASV